MKKLAQWLVTLLALGVVLTVFGCGDDDDTNGGEAGLGGSGGESVASGGSGGNSGRTSAAGSGGSSSGGSSSGNNSGDMQEGGLCRSSADCQSGLNCVIAPFDDETGAPVCARPCVEDTDCEAGEGCTTATGRGADLHCENIRTEPLGQCGPADTSICDAELFCLPDLALDEPFGTCFNLCRLPTTTSDSPLVLESCPSGQSCVDVGVGTVGVCGKPVARGEACSITGGNLCNSGDICITELSMGMVVSSLCFQECTQNGVTCEDGKTCTPIDPTGMDQTKFCM